MTQVNVSTADLHIEDVVISYRLNGKRIEAVSRFNAAIGAGESVCLVGPSGCGKTSVLRAVAGFVRPESGVIRLGNMQLTRPGLDIGVVFQDGGLLPWLTAEKNVEFGLLHRVSDKAERSARVSEWLDKVGLSGFSHARPNALSGGMKQRVAIARTLAGSPQVVLMDEPFGALDAQTRTAMQDLTASLITENKMTTLFVTHDIDESLIIGDRIIVMSGRPGVIADEITNPFPRPRLSAAIYAKPEYATLKSRILRTLMPRG